MARLGVITGLVSEARCFDDSVRVRCRGMGPNAASEAARSLVDEGCPALLSFGIAGGLDAALPAGTVVVAEAVIDTDGKSYPTAAEWRAGLVQLLEGNIPVASGVLAGSDRVVPTPAGKRRLAAATGAVAVDMESHAVARVAAERRVPLLVVRAISDPLEGTIPRSAMLGVDAYGRRRPMRVAAALLRRPGDLPALLCLRRDSARAMEALGRVAVLAGPGFGLAQA